MGHRQPSHNQCALSGRLGTRAGVPQWWTTLRDERALSGLAERREHPEQEHPAVCDAGCSL